MRFARNLLNIAIKFPNTNYKKEGKEFRFTIHNGLIANNMVKLKWKDKNST